MHANERPGQLKRRAFVLGGLQLAGLSVLAGRLYQLQFLQGEEYRSLAEGNRIKLRLITPSRGVLTDRYGAILAQNGSNYRLLLDRENTKQAQKTWETLRTLHDFSVAREIEISKTVQYYHSQPLLLEEYVSWDVIAKLESYHYALPALRIEQGEVRDYLLGETAAHIIGYVGRLSERDKYYKTLRKLPHVQHGKLGAELLYEESLRGRAGSRQLEVNATGVAVRELSKDPSESGDNLALTLDADLQRFCGERLGDESAAVVVMDIAGGDVLSLASTPAYDPNLFSRGIRSDYWKSLLENEKKPLVNKAMSGQYPPGSTFKMLVALRALKEGIIHPRKTVFCPGHFDLGNHRFNCWRKGGHGNMNVSQAIIESCDTFFYQIAHQLGIEKIAETARDFGLGETSGIGLLGEQSGLVPTPQWKRKRRNQPWAGGDTVNASIGQGFVLSTPLQLAVMTARLASGKKVRPHLLMQDARQEWEHLDYDQAHLDIIAKAMRYVVSQPNGTAYGHRPKAPDYSFGGKTGTSQVRRILERGVDQSTLPWEQRHHALFVAFAPDINPKWAISVVVEHGGSGSAAAAPIAHDIARHLQQRTEEADGA